MPRKQVKAQAPAEEPVAVQEAPKPESEAKKNYRALIEAYAKQNPVKFEGKKAAMYRKLEAME